MFLERVVKKEESHILCKYTFFNMSCGFKIIDKGDSHYALLELEDIWADSDPVLSLSIFVLRYL
jgi:hypothetical protein